MPFLFGAGYRRLGTRYFASPVVLLTLSTFRLLKMKETGVEARGEAELRGITEPVALYRAATDLDERSTLRSESLITDA